MSFDHCSHNVDQAAHADMPTTSVKPTQFYVGFLLIHFVFSRILFYLAWVVLYS